jgi:hypothetical protein
LNVAASDLEAAAPAEAAASASTTAMSESFMAGRYSVVRPSVSFGR